MTQDEANAVHVAHSLDVVVGDLLRRGVEGDREAVRVLACLTAGVLQIAHGVHAYMQEHGGFDDATMVDLALQGHSPAEIQKIIRRQQILRN